MPFLSADPRLRSFPDAKFSVSTHPPGFGMAFNPDYEPQQMIRMGIFGDAYFGDELGQLRAKLLPSEFQLVKNVGEHYTDTRGKQCSFINYYGRPASETREWWLQRGLIIDIDPLGWFEWYCHYWLGRRVTLYDDWQITRWHRFKERQLNMYWQTRYLGTAQALLHWAIRAE